jgi:hypothetical protein
MGEFFSCILNMVGHIINTTGYVQFQTDPFVMYVVSADGINDNPIKMTVELVRLVSTEWTCRQIKTYGDLALVRALLFLKSIYAST